LNLAISFLELVVLFQEQFTELLILFNELPDLPFISALLLEFPDVDLELLEISELGLAFSELLVEFLVLLLYILSRYFEEVLLLF
jgi:hypothetical protein